MSTFANTCEFGGHHNLFSFLMILQDNSEDTIKMEHSYTRDHNPIENVEVIATRTILMKRPPLCPQCNLLPLNHDEKVDAPETFNIPIPAYNEESGRSSLNATENAIKNCPNPNSDSDDWTLKIDKSIWTGNLTKWLIHEQDSTSVISPLIPIKTFRSTTKSI